MAIRRQPLRLLADDLTGALDAAAAFASPSEPVPVCWREAVPRAGAVALDSRTREALAEEACAAVAAVAGRLFAPGSGLAFKKIDSLLRGPQGAEIAAILEVLKPSRCVVAPAFPAQGRITRGGRQCVLIEGAARPVPADLGDELRRAGHEVMQARPGDAVPAGLSLWDAESDADLDAIVAAAGGAEEVLWIGSAGLAAALARAMGFQGEGRAAALPAPVVGFVGSEHETMRAQLAAMGARHLRLSAQMCGEPAEIGRRLAADGIVLASVDLPAGISRGEAARAIEARFGALLAELDRPGTLFAAGGETLRGLCEALGAERLDAVGEVAPGVPRSILRGGRWDGVTVVSKSGAFGGPDLLNDIFAGRSAALAGAAA
ncbi:four-carbon acid sugar kinase family protein [Bosea sp. TAB14]|jgi:uncharacterized protein YgbK (DUF1537 family)|uniref:four-carbon acid sugar kinase family protein n=1 Tax=Bosea sp. TAB14 TaxID=3237481 RepID=UPI003F8F0EB8